MRNTTPTSVATCPSDSPMPASGANARITMPWIQASVAEPMILPSTRLVRDAGETSMESRNPSRRSSMIDMVEKIAENITVRSEEHTSELQSPCNLVCRLLLEKKKKNTIED